MRIIVSYVLAILVFLSVISACNMMSTMNKGQWNDGWAGGKLTPNPLEDLGYTLSEDDYAALTPLSLSNRSNSPDWYISRTISQPPMNSPLT